MSFWVFARLTVTLCIVSMIALVFYRAAIKITLFLGVTFMAVGEMNFFLAHMFFELGNHLFRLWDWCLEKGYISSLNYSQIVNTTIIFNQILLCAVGATLLYFTMRKIVWDYREKDYAIHRTELLFILTPGVTGLMEYARLNEESALKRRLMEQEADERYYKDSITKKAVSVAAYEAAGILK